MEVRIGENMISVFYGTRPEYIKVKRLYDLMREHFDVELVKVSQHTTLTDGCYCDREIFVNNDTANRLSSVVQSTLNDVTFPIGCSLVVVQGDTATAFGIALNAFHHKIPVAHVEAGLRTFDNRNPFPEEAYRRCISAFADYHFCATESNSLVLAAEKVNGKVYTVGNTGLDNIIGTESSYGDEVLVTLHRRENKEMMANWFSAIEEAACQHPNLKFVFPIHPSPDVMKHRHILKTVAVCDPLPHTDLVQLLARCRFVVTDSGGIQEEASFLKKKTIVCRSHTERSEGIGVFSFLCETPNRLADLLHTVDNNHMVNEPCPYGDGKAAEKIVSILKKELYNG